METMSDEDYEIFTAAKRLSKMGLGKGDDATTYFDPEDGGIHTRLPSWNKCPDRVRHYPKMVAAIKALAQTHRSWWKSAYRAMDLKLQAELEGISEVDCLWVWPGGKGKPLKEEVDIGFECFKHHRAAYLQSKKAKVAPAAKKEVKAPVAKKAAPVAEESALVATTKAAPAPKLKVTTTKTSTTITTSFTAAKAKPAPEPKTKPLAAPMTEEATREETMRIFRKRSPFWYPETEKLCCKWVELTKPEEIDGVTKDPKVDPKVGVLVANLGASVSVADESLDSKVLVPLCAYAQQQYRRMGGFLLVICLSLDVPAGKQVEACIKAYRGMLSKHLGFEFTERGLGRYKSEQGEERSICRISFGF